MKFLVALTYSSVIMSLCTKNIFYLILFFTSYIGSKGSKNYGQFEIQMTDAKSCKGPKRKDCANTTITLQGSSTISCSISLDKEIGSIKGKVIGTLGNEEIIKMQIRKVCDHIFFMTLFKAIFTVTDNCVIVKKDYRFALNIGEIMKKYHDATFMFGNWTYKAIFYNDDCNFTCGVFQITIAPK